MRPKLLVNDLHLGVQRTGGTTIESALALRQYLLNATEQLIAAHTDKDLIINGDLFDAFAVPLWDLLGAHRILRQWLVATEVSWNRLYLGRGNHDWSKDSTKLSSFDLLGQILRAEFGERVGVVTEPMQLESGLWMIPHMPNQEAFNEALAAAEKLESCLVLLHANYDNNFATASDHSLNVSKEQAARIVARDCALVFGHEHQARRAQGGQVYITGNQFPSSVADCLGNPENEKHAHVLEFDGVADWQVLPVKTWDADDFAEIDWQAPAADSAARFVRVVGTATTEQAADMVSVIAKLRQRSTAFVVANAVKVEGVADMADLPASMEDVRAFDVLGFLLEQLEPAQADVVKRLLSEAEQQEQKEAA